MLNKTFEIANTKIPSPDAPLPVQVTGVKLNPTDTGIEVILETPQGEALKPRAIALGKSYIANIPNAVLALQPLFSPDYSIQPRSVV